MLDARSCRLSIGCRFASKRHQDRGDCRSTVLPPLGHFLPQELLHRLSQRWPQIRGMSYPYTMVSSSKILLRRHLISRAREAADPRSLRARLHFRRLIFLNRTWQRLACILPDTSSFVGAYDMQKQTRHRPAIDWWPQLMLHGNGR